MDWDEKRVYPVLECSKWEKRLSFVYLVLELLCDNRTET